MSGTILKNDIISDAALKRIDELVRKFEVMATTADKVNAALKNSGLKGVNENTRKANTLTKNYIKNTKEFNSLIKLGQQRQKEYMKELTKRAQAAQKVARDETRSKKQSAAMIKLLINARQTEAGSLTRLNAVNNIYKQRMKELNVLIPAQAKQYARLTKSIQNNQKRMAQMATTAKTGGRQFNMLQWQIMQVSREMPAFAYGMNVGISALSNNLPMLFDEINNVRKANKLLATEGKATTSVLKQITASIFSWQTALVAIVTIFTMYGQEISDFINKLFKTSNQLKGTARAQQELNNTLNEGTKNAQSEITKLEILYSATQDVSLAMNSRQKAVDELQKMYPNYLGNIEDEKILAGEAAESYYDLRDAIVAKAIAQARENKITEISERILENQIKINEKRQKLRERAGDGSAVTFMPEAGIGKIARINQLKQQIKEDEELIRQIASGIDIDALLMGGSEGENGVGSDSPKKKGKSYGEKLLSGLQDAYDSHYTKRLSLARNDAEETIEIKREMVHNELLMDLQFSQLTLNEREELYAKLRELDDEYYDYKTNQEIAGIYERADEERIAEAQRAREEFQSTKKRGQDKQLIMAESAMNMIEIERNAINEILAIEELSADERAKYEQELAKLRERYAEADIRLTEQKEKKKREEIRETLNAGKEVGQALFDFNSALNERAMAANETRFRRETELAGENAEQKAIAEVKYNEKKRELQRRQAIADKANSAFSIIVDTAAAIMETLKQTGIAGIPLTPIIAGIGALQLATVLAQPIPQFAKGTKDAPETFVAGEEGREFVSTKDNKVFLTPDAPTLFSDKSFIGSTILPNDQTEMILSGRSGGSSVDLKNTNSLLKEIRDKKDNKEVVEYVGNYRIVNKNGLKMKFRV